MHELDVEGAGLEVLAALAASLGEPWPDTLTAASPSGGAHLILPRAAPRLHCVVERDLPVAPLPGWIAGRLALGSSRRPSAP